MAVRIGVIGTGHFGRFHALKLAARGCLSGIRNLDAARAEAVAAETGALILTEAELIARSDAVVVAVPTAHHHACGMRVLEAGRHLFVEKPMAATVPQAAALVEAAVRRRLVLQVGHIERHSAAIRALRASGAARAGAVAFNAVRVAPFRPRGLDVSVVLDLMIHDLDLLLDLAGSPLREVRAVGRAVVTPFPDFAVAQLGFENGASATITASRVSVALERRLRLLGPGGEVRVDFLARSLEALRPGGAEPAPDMPAGWGTDRATWTEHDSLDAELGAFIAAVAEGAPVEANGATGLRALDAALRVEAAIAAGT